MASAPTPRPEIFVGVVVSKATLGVAVEGREVSPIRNTLEGVADRAKRLKAVLMAVARKPVVIANPILRAQRPWNPEIAASAT